MKLTKAKVIQHHRELWNWLYHNPSKWKHGWPEWKRLKEKYRPRHVNDACRSTTGFLNDCFPCHYSDLNCDKCIFDWGGYSCEDIESGDDKNIFAKWEDAGTTKTRKKYAKLIRDVPVKK